MLLWILYFKKYKWNSINLLYSNVVLLYLSLSLKGKLFEAKNVCFCLFSQLEPTDQYMFVLLAPSTVFGT